MNLSFSKNERLVGKTLFQKTFTYGKVFQTSPFKFYCLSCDFKDKSLIKIAFVVSKKTHPSAVSRNKIKRKIKEAYRLNQFVFLKDLKKPHAIVILYLAKEILPQKTMNQKIKLIFSRFLSNC